MNIRTKLEDLAKNDVNSNDLIVLCLSGHKETILPLTVKDGIAEFGNLRVSIEDEFVSVDSWIKLFSDTYIDIALKSAEITREQATELVTEYMNNKEILQIGELLIKLGIPNQVIDGRIFLLK
jgi:hypothetical protein